MHQDVCQTQHVVVRDVSGFDKNSGSLLERLLFNNRLIIVIACLVVTVVLTYQALGLHINASFERMIPTNHPYITNYNENKSELAGLGNVLRIAVATENGTIFDSDYLDTLRRMNDEIFLMPGVDRPYMKSLWTPAVRWIGVTEVGLDGGPVIPDTYNGSKVSLAQVRANVERSGEIGQLVSANYKSSIIHVPLAETVGDSGERIDYHELSHRLEAFRQKYEAEGIRIHITGFSKLVGDLIEGLYEVLIFFAGTIGIATVVLYWYTRCVRSTLLVVFCSLTAVVWLLGLLPTLDYELDPYSILVPFLVFAIGMSHGAQKMNGIMQDVGRGTHKLVAARYTFRRLFLAGLTALLADAVGFAVLMIIEIPVIQDLAVSASIGVAVLVFTNLLLLPILLSYTGVSGSAAKRSLSAETLEEKDLEHKKHPFWTMLDHFVERKWATIAVITAAMMGVGGFMISLDLKIGDLDSGAPELRPDSRYNRDNAFIVSNYVASSDIYVIMVKTPQFECALYDTQVKVDLLEQRLQQLPGVESTKSFASLAKSAAANMNEGSLKWYDLPRTQGMLNAIATRAPRELFNQNCDLLTVYIYLKDHKAETLESVVNGVENFALQYDTEKVKFLSAAGNSGIEAATNIVVKRANVQMLLLVYSAVIVLAFVTFRSWRGVVCAVLPLMLTSILCEALMVWLGIGVKVATLPVIALGVGIGVDYALYILTVTLAGLRNGLSLSDAYYKALTFTGKVVVLTGITLGIGVVTWAFSPIKFQADMGILLAFMFIWNMLGALILLPALGYFLLKPSMPAGIEIDRALGKSYVRKSRDVEHSESLPFRSI
jgi:predicted RND superfamily exporter protein